MVAFNLRGQEEWIFRQSYMGGDQHIALNAWEYEDMLAAHEFKVLRIQTYCGKDLKYNPNWSSMEKRSNICRRMCIFCATEYERTPPEEKKRERTFSGSEIVYYKDDLPF